MLSVIVNYAPRSFAELNRLVDRRFGALLALDSARIAVILQRLEHRGLVEGSW